jgi:hypothetical protein
MRAVMLFTKNSVCSTLVASVKTVNITSEKNVIKRRIPRKVS